MPSLTGGGISLSAKSSIEIWVGKDGLVHNLSPVFSDRDTISPDGTAAYVSHYTASQRIFYKSTDSDFQPVCADPTNGVAKAPGTYGERKIGPMKPATAFIIWDAAQVAYLGGNAYGLATEMDSNRLTYGHGFMNLMPVAGTEYDRVVCPGGNGTLESPIANAAVNKQRQIMYNKDQQFAYESGAGGGPDGWLCQLRFRHIRNTRMNGLCIDGHVEGRQVGAAIVSDFCTNSPY